jgi:hypothetical protein
LLGDAQCDRCAETDTDMKRELHNTKVKIVLCGMIPVFLKLVFQFISLSSFLRLRITKMVCDVAALRRYWSSS